MEANQGKYVRPELFDLGDATQLTQGGGSDCSDNPTTNFKKVGCDTFDET